MSKIYFSLLQIISSLIQLGCGLVQNGTEFFMGNQSKTFTIKYHLCVLFFGILGFWGAAQAQSLEFTSGDGNPTATNGPAQTTNIRFRYNNDNPSGNTFQTYTPAVTASYQLTNQQFTFAPISTNRPVNFGYTTTGGTSVFQSLDTYGAPSAAWYTSNGASTGTGINTTSNFGVVLNANTTPLRVSGAATSVTQHWMSDLVVTFSQPVNNPILHIAGMGGTVSTFGFSQEYDVISSNTSVTLTRLSGSNAFGVTGTKINNTATAMAATGTNNSGSGSVMINGTGIATLTIRVYIRGDGSSAASTSWATSNTAIDSGDTATLGFSFASTSGNCITTPPSTTAQNLCLGGSATPISVTATGATSYQWYYSDAANGGTITTVTGATSASYTPPTTATFATRYYFVTVETSCGTYSSYPRSPVTVNANPAFTTNLTAGTQTVCLNGTVTALTVAAAAGNTYQWYSNTTNSNTGGTVISGATSGTYTPPSTTAGTTYYYAVITNTTTGCSTPSNVRGVIVLPELAITTQPASAAQNLCLNGSAPTLSVAATGASTYQWSYSTAATGGTITAVSGATSASYTIPTTATFATRYYFVTVSNGTCSVSSSPRTPITVNANPAFTTNLAAGTQTVCLNGTVTALTVAAAAGNTYQWYSNTANSNTGGTVISGATSGTYTPPSTTSGTTYYYAVITNTTTGCSTSSNVRGVTVNGITSQPITSQTVCQFTMASTISVVTTTPATAYQWYYNTTNTNVGGTLITGATASSYTPPTANLGTLYYFVQVTVGGCVVRSATSEVIVNCILDSDNDGVADYLDLDDDNDGILDANEMTCVTLNAVQPTPAGAVSSYSGTGIPLFNATFRISTVQTAAYTYVANLFGYTNVTAVAAQTNTGSPVNSITFNRPVYSLDTALDDVDGSETATLRLYDESNNLIPGSVVQQYVVFIGNQIGSVNYPAGQSINVVGTAVSSTTVQSAVRMTFPKTIGISRIEYEQLTMQSGGSNNGLILMNGCVDVDTDGDGTWNRYDLDSDNDGCLDAVEGDENVTVGQLVTAAPGLTSGTGSPALNQNLCNTSSCVNSNGVPSIVNSGGAADIGGDEGQGIGESQNVSLGCSPVTCSVNMYLSQNANTQLFLFDRSTNPITYPPIGSASGIQYNAIAISPINGEMYGMKNASRTLIGINSNGTFVELGDITGMPAGTTFSYNTGEIDDQGNYYVTPAGSGVTTMYKINIATKTATTITLSQGLQISDLAYNINDGKLYSVNIDGRFLSINTTTGLVTFIGTTTGPMTFGAMFGSPSGIFGADNNGGLYQIDVATGVKIKISDSPASGTNDGAHCVTMPITFDADLYVTKTDNTQFYTPGSNTVYTIVVGNNGIFGAQNAHVTDSVPTGIPNANMTYTAVVSSGSTTTVTGTMTGAINDYVSLPIGGTVTYTVTVSVPLNFTGSLSNTATITPSSATSDNNLANNTATDTDMKIITACDPVVWYHTDDDKLYAADVNTGVSTLVCNNFYTIGEGVFDIGFNTSGILYSVNYNFSEGKSYFYRFNTSNCTFTKLTNTGGIELAAGSNSLSFLPDGTALLGNNFNTTIQRITLSGNNYTVSNWYTITDPNASISGGDFILFEGKIYAAMLNSSLENYMYELALDPSYNATSIQNIYPDTSGLSEYMFGMAQSGGDLYGGFTDNTVRRLIFSPGSMTFSANVLNAPASGQIYGMTSLQEAFGVQNPVITSDPAATNGTLAVCTIIPISVELTSSLSTGIQWYKDNVLIPGATSQTYTASALGSYTVAYTQANSCIYIADPIIITGGGSCACYKPGATTGGAILDTQVGITSLARAGVNADNWPMVRKGGWIALESKTKGFVLNRVAFSDADNNAATPDVPIGINSTEFVEGMAVYDITDNCLKIYTSQDNGNTFNWYCISVQTCPDL